MKTCQKCGAQYDGSMSFCPRDGEVLPEEKARMTGRILDGQYEIEAFIAEGGMGAVYRARHTLLGDRVAIKILPPEMRQNTEWLKRFQREGQAARRFHHPNSVIVHDFRTSSEGEVYLVMEYVEGRTLDQELLARGGHLAPNEILRLIEPIGSVLDAAHQMGVVHRDLKPSNIMLTERGVVKVLDLGVAKLSDLDSTDVQLTTAGQMLGTPYYMSPEQWGELQRDGRFEIDGRADVYSLGVVVYEMTIGQRPFDAATVGEFRHKHCRVTPLSPASFDSSLPAGWASAVMRALAKDRGDRPASAGEFVHELRASLNSDAQSYVDPQAAVRTLLSPPGMTQAALSPATPANQHRATVQGYAQATPHPQSPPSAPFIPASGPSHVASQSPTKPRSMMVLGVIILAAFVVIGASGFAVWKWKAGGQAETSPTAREANQTKPSESVNDNVENATSEGQKVVSADGAFMRYHLLLGESVLDLGERATGRDSIKPGQSLQLAITPSVSGYLYLIGQDNQGTPVVMPVNMLAPEMEVAAGEEAVVPNLAAIKLNTQPGTDSLTVILTQQRLTLPFVTETLPLDGTFRKLTTDERQKIEVLRREAAPVKTQYTDAEGGTALIKLTGERGSRPVIFDIKLKLER